MKLVQIDPGYRRKIVLSSMLPAGLLIFFLVAPEDEFIWQSQPIARYPMTALMAGATGFCLLILVWLVRSGGGVVLRATDEGLVALAPVWALRREFIPVTSLERPETSIAVKNERNGADIDGPYQPTPTDSWLLMIETPSRDVRVKLRGIQMKSGYGEKVKLWRQAAEGHPTR